MCTRDTQDSYSILISIGSQVLLQPHPIPNPHHLIPAAGEHAVGEHDGRTWWMDVCVIHHLVIKKQNDKTNTLVVFYS